MIGILTLYHILKEIFIRIIKQGFNTSVKDKRYYPKLITNQIEWDEVLTKVQYYAAMLGELGYKIDVNDLNEGIKRECYPGLLKKTPTSEPLPSHQCVIQIESTHKLDLIHEFMS